MKRKIIEINEEKCNGCGQCIPNCQEGALQMIDEKARLISDLFCDGLGACIGHCPEGVITIIERESEPYHERKVMEMIVPKGRNTRAGYPDQLIEAKLDTPNAISELTQWPVQLHLLNPQASYFRNADVILTADCVPFTTGNFHARFLKGKSLAIACPKLDTNKDSYVQKLISMIADAKINSLSVLMMEVPCCGGLLAMAETARNQAGRNVPVKRIIISIRGEVMEEDWT